MLDNLFWHNAPLTRNNRQQLNGHRSFIIWFTGLSGSGKSTLAHALDEALYQRGIRSFVLDGDNIRHGLNQDLGFSVTDRHENIRRIGEVSLLFVDAGLITIAAFISPFRRDRELIRQRVNPGDFIEIYVKCPLDICENRDPKGLYKKARLGEISQFTGINSPYEEPQTPEIVIDTSQISVEVAIQNLLTYLDNHGLILQK